MGDKSDTSYDEGDCWFHPDPHEPTSELHPFPPTMSSPSNDPNEQCVEEGQVWYPMNMRQRRPAQPIGGLRPPSVLNPLQRSLYHIGRSLGMQPRGQAMFEELPLPPYPAPPPRSQTGRYGLNTMTPPCLPCSSPQGLGTTTTPDQHHDQRGHPQRPDLPIPHQPLP